MLAKEAVQEQQLLEPYLHEEERERARARAREREREKIGKPQWWERGSSSGGLRSAQVSKETQKAQELQAASRGRVKVHDSVADAALKLARCVKRDLV